MPGINYPPGFIGYLKNIGKPNQPYILDLTTMERLYLQTIPSEINVTADVNWKTIEAVGRNVPRYHWVGSEDSIDFTIGWYSDQENREDVIRACKFLESLSKLNTPREPIHLVKFMFGSLFSDSTFIVHSAPYRLGMFDRPYKMLPTVAQQVVTLKRVSEVNPTRNDYLNPKF